MNTVLSTRVDEQHQAHARSPHRVTNPRQVTLPDRVALHLGLALITWSRRARTAPLVREYNSHARREREQYLRQLEQRSQAEMHVTRPWR